MLHRLSGSSETSDCDSCRPGLAAENPAYTCNSCHHPPPPKGLQGFRNQFLSRDSIQCCFFVQMTPRFQFGEQLSRLLLERKLGKQGDVSARGFRLED